MALSTHAMLTTALWTGYASNEEGTETKPLDSLYDVDDVPAEDCRQTGRGLGKLY